MLRNGLVAMRAVARETGAKDKRGMADWLCLAASPAFAVMAWLTWRDGQAGMICSLMGGSPLSGMVPMYLLMSLFHAAPWLRLASWGWRCACRS